MKIATAYNRLTSRTFTLTTADIKQAIREYIEKHIGELQPPSNARQEIEIDLDGDCHAEAAVLVQRFIFDEEPPEGDKEQPCL